MTKKHQFGIGLLGDADISEIPKYASLAEDMGYDVCWIAEDYFCGGAFSIAAACAAATNKINLAIGVINPYTRHPLLSAMEAASLYEVSNQRITIGLGSSNPVWIQQQMGIPYVKQLASISETTQIMREFYKGDEFSFNGDVFQVNNVLPRTPKCEDLPIYHGVKSRKMLQQAGAVADGVLLSVGTSANYVSWVKEQIRAGADTVGRSLDGFTIAAYLIFSIDEDRELARSRVKNRLAYYLGLHGRHDIMRQAGVSEDLCDLFREGFLSGNPRSDLITDELIDTFTISGEPEECRKRFQKLLDAGITQAVVYQIPEISMEDNMAQVRDYIFT